jgi:hypothetical protein
MLTATRFFQARAAWHHELAEAICNYHRCGLVIHGRNQLSVVGAPRSKEKAIATFKSVLKVIRDLTAHLKNDKHLRKSLSAGLADVLSNEFIGYSKPLPRRVRRYMDERVDMQTRSRDYNGRAFRKGQLAALDTVAA